MELKDLANQRSRQDPQDSENPVGSKGLKWLVIESQLLPQEKIVLVFNRKYLKEARQENPGKAIYFPLEVDELLRYRTSPDYPELVNTIQRLKKEFGGWIVPENSPLARKLDRQKTLGLDDLVHTKRE